MLIGGLIDGWAYYVQEELRAKSDEDVASHALDQELLNSEIEKQQEQIRALEEQVR